MDFLSKKKAQSAESADAKTDTAKTGEPQRAFGTQEKRVGGPEANTSSNVESDSAALYSSHPVMRFKVGRFQFDRGLLTLTKSKDKEDFQKLLNSLEESNPRDFNRIRKLDPEAAMAMVNVSEPSMSKQFDSSVGRQNATIQGQEMLGKVVLDPDAPEGQGQGERFVKLPQQDANVPQAGTPAGKVANVLNQSDVDLTSEERAKQAEDDKA